MKRKDINKIKNDILDEIEIYDFPKVKKKAEEKENKQIIYYKNHKLGYIIAILVLSFIAILLLFDNLRLNHFYFPCGVDQGTSQSPYEQVLNFNGEQVNSFYLAYYIYETIYPFDKEYEEMICLNNGITKEELFKNVYKTLLKYEYDKAKNLLIDQYKDNNVTIIMNRMDYSMRTPYDEFKY